MEKIAMYKEEIMKVASQKKDDASRQKDMETRVWRDRVKPELKRGFKSMPRTIGGAAAGLTKRRELEKQELDRLSKKHFGRKATRQQHETVGHKTLAASALSAIPGPVGVAGTVGRYTKTPESVIQRARREKASK